MAMAPPILRKTFGSLVVLAHLPRQRSIAHTPRARIAALRDARAAAMARYAATTVPWYRETFRRLGLEAGDIRCAADLARLPLIDKDDLRRDPERFVSTSRAGRSAIPFVSSGTSGKPAPIFHDRRSLLANVAYGERERQVVTALVGRELDYREATIGYPRGTIDRVREFYRAATLFRRPQRIQLSVMSSFAEVAATLADFRPDVIAGFGNYLAALARAVARGEVSLPRPRVLIYTAEALSRERRREIEASLGAPLLSFYSAVEAFKIAFLCEERRGFHLHEDLCHVRIVDGEGGTLPPGAAGQVVISNLVNRGTVLLNYRLGDVAAASATPCPCGRTLPMLEDLEGRVEDMLPLPDGRLLHPRAVWGVVRDCPAVLQYQVVQRGPADFVLRLVIAPADFERVAAGLAQRLEHLLGAGARVHPERHERLAAERSGKLRLVVAQSQGVS